VVIDLPLDVQMAEIDFSIDQYSLLPVEIIMPESGTIAKAAELLLSAKNPVIILGGGVVLSGAVDECRQLAELTNIPVITTYMAKGVLPVNHPLNVGSMGIQVGNPLGNRIFLESDVVLGIGCRFTDRHTGDIKIYQGDRKFIHINIEPREIGKIVKTEVGIVADAKMAVKALMEKIKSMRIPAPATRVKDIPRLQKELKRKTFFDSKPIKPQRVFHEINSFFTQDTIFTTGCGLNQIWSGQFQEINKPRLYLPSGGAGTLGFDIPAAFGAKLARPGLHAVAVMGDFGFTFLVEELAVAASSKVPVIVIILNNAYLSLIRQNQKYAYQYEYAVKMPENHSLIDYVKVSQGFGCQSERVTEPSAIKGALERAAKSTVPYVIDIIVEENTDCSMGPSVAAVKEFE
jgi:tartronate-semialdehyde synthase